MQTLGPAPRHSAFLNISQEIWACRIQKNLQGSLGAVAVSCGGGASILSVLLLHKLSSHLSADLRTWGVGVDLRKQCKGALSSWVKVRLGRISSQDEGAQKQPGQTLHQGDGGLSRGNTASEQNESWGVRSQTCDLPEPTWSQHVRLTSLSDLLKQPVASPLYCNFFHFY